MSSTDSGRRGALEMPPSVPARRRLGAVAGPSNSRLPDGLRQGQSTTTHPELAPCRNGSSSSPQSAIERFQCHSRLPISSSAEVQGLSVFIPRPFCVDVFRAMSVCVCLRARKIHKPLRPDTMQVAGLIHLHAVQRAFANRGCHIEEDFSVRRRPLAVGLVAHNGR